MTRCFLLTPSGRTVRLLRRYSRELKENLCGTSWSHTATGQILDVVTGESPSGDLWPHDDARYPTKCERCNYAFTPGDEYQLFCKSLYRRSDTGEETTINDAPPGAMWFADWNPLDIGPDGRCLMVKCPDGHNWCVDGEASNCGRKGDRSHKCWVRHGTPPDITVDKNGDTCNAGAGSILTPRWHGFLRNGVLVPC